MTHPGKGVERLVGARREVVLSERKGRQVECWVGRTLRGEHSEWGWRGVEDGSTGGMLLSL